MEALFAKMQEYLKMTTEISFAEFSEYYQKVLDFLMSDFDNLDKDALLKMSGVCQITALNASGRSMRKDANSKKFGKMGAKMKFWQDAIDYKLNKEYGMTAEDIEEAVEALWQE